MCVWFWFYCCFFVVVLFVVGSIHTTFTLRVYLFIVFPFKKCACVCLCFVYLLKTIFIAYNEWNVRKKHKILLWLLWLLLVLLSTDERSMRHISHIFATIHRLLNTFILLSYCCGVVLRLFFFALWIYGVCESADPDELFTESNWKERKTTSSADNVGCCVVAFHCNIRSTPGTAHGPAYDEQKKER